MQSLHVLRIIVLFAADRFYNGFVLADNIDVETKFGNVTGIEVTYLSKPVYQFRGMPYALPPLGNRRFVPPVAYGNWTGALNATAFGPACLQPMRMSNDRSNSMMNEDCLYLNIFVPFNISKSNKKAVMVWIHGGGFQYGNSKSYDGSLLALTGDVIVVTLNYRLNVFGFFSMGTRSYSGNLGLWDQHMAFRWVHEAIQDFGGDPNKVTIFGESAGAFSVSAHIMSPINKGLFQRAIMQSGSILRPIDDDGYFTRKTSYQIAKLLNCTDTRVKNMVKCLRSVPSSVLLATYLRVSRVHSPGDIVFAKIGLVADSVFIRKNAREELRNRNSSSSAFFSTIDIMAGTNTGDAGVLYNKLVANHEKLHFNVTEGITQHVFRDVIVPIVGEYAFEKCEDIEQGIVSIYSPKNESNNEQTKMASNLLGDIIFQSPTIALIEIHANISQQKTYRYLFAHRPQWELFGDRPSWLQGPNHASDVPFIFGLRSWYPANKNISEQEANLSHRMMKYWSNFAKSGNPNDNGKDLWKEFKEDYKYLELNVNDGMGNEFDNDQLTFWNSQAVKLLNQCRKTNVVVNTQKGKFRGKINHVRDVDEFKRIPFAQPPIQHLRFKKPKPIEDIRTGIVDAFNYGPCCYQNIYPNDARLVPNKNLSEDCLHLNIFVPKSVDPPTKWPVMIWIHGGGFTNGQSSMYDASILSSYGNVIVVTINYRLNIFGFFSTGNENYRGNYGLYDQQMAFRWVKENIEAFGGDPGLITLFGNSAGGVSTTLQSVIPSNKGLFQRVIGESGSCFSMRDVNTRTLSTSGRVIEILNCTRKTVEDSVDCLQQVSPRELLDTYYRAAYEPHEYTLTTAIGPITDGELIPENPQISLKNVNSEMYKMFKSVDLLVGTNTADSVLLYFNLMRYAKSFNFNLSLGIPTRIICDHIAPSITRDILNNCKAATKEICKEYTPKGDNPTLDSQTQMAANLYSDLLEDAPTVESLEIHSSHPNTGRKSYQYLLSQRPSWELISDRPPWLKGVSHASEVPVIFGLDYFYPNGTTVTPEDRDLSNRMMRYWTNFAKYGNPAGMNDSLTWPQYDPRQRSYLVLGKNDSIATNLFSSRLDFWNSDIPKILSSCNARSISNEAPAFASHSLVVYLSSFLLCFCFVYF